MSWRRIGCPQCGPTGTAPSAASATALTLRWSAANICWRYSISTSRSNNRKLGDHRPTRAARMEPRIPGEAVLSPGLVTLRRWLGGIAACRRCWRASTSSSALIASNSAAVCLNFRPAWTRGRMAASHSAGMVSTRFLPAAMKVTAQNGWPPPLRNGTKVFRSGDEK